MFMDPGVNLELRINENVKTVLGINYRIADEKESINGLSVTVGTQAGVF